MSTLYAEHFHLKEAPFSIAPNPRFLFMSDQHREALAHLLYGIGHDGGFVLLTGEVGTGKTTLCRCLLEKVPEDTDVAFIINPRLSVVDLLANICDELHIPYDRDRLNNRLLVDAINHYLLDRHAGGRKTVLVIDEAQNLDAEVLEQLRLLTNLETDERKLLQIILLGQPELQDKLSRPELRQLSQRVTARYHLQALSYQDMQTYITHRLGVAGCDQSIFAPSALRFLHRRSQGIPRLINLICDRAMLGAFASGVGRIERAMVQQAAREVLGEQHEAKETSRAGLIMRVALATLVLGISVWAGDHWLARQSAPALTAANQAATVPSTQPGPALAAKASSAAAENSNVPVDAAIPAEAAVPVDMVLPEENASAPIPGAAQQEAAVAGQDRQAAFRELFAIWGIVLPENSKPCAFAETQGLACLKLIGDVGKLRSLNRPAVIDWREEGQDSAYLTLTAVDGARAHAVVGGQSVEMPLQRLQLHWLDSFTLLWRIPPAYQSDILPGTAGPSAKWLNDRLSALDPNAAGEVPTQVSGLYQGKWVLRLRRFQRDAGLLPDGVAGPQTLIRLNTALNEPGPRLMAGTGKTGQTAAMR